MKRDEFNAVMAGPFVGLFDSIASATGKVLGPERGEYVAGKAIISASSGLAAMHTGLGGGIDIQTDMDNLSALHVALQILRDHLTRVIDNMQADPTAVLTDAARESAATLRAAGQEEHAEYYDEMARRIEQGGVVSEYVEAKPDAKTFH
jgi:hypothetical protein